ncbi:hypothetical protein PVT68_13240 [Microbulbifer bruguierae]|uniref:Uncharacterized protein n=1 Tax=Microbulbifer bruguierae TaxID=3029061 RepID=A0ABY8NAP2_9GAMM|nr:hypothetical protein [Microbulbifer bruguierae]WGL15730.1 hypothetical protein PVT68_13240 [Microbulbifer bruguierae]
MKISSKGTAVISCILGTEFHSVYPAPQSEHSFLFSNRRDLFDEFAGKGWNPILLEFPLSRDDAVSSLQAKYVKFLQFLKESTFRWFDEFETIVYVDHKFFLNQDHLEFIEKTRKKDIFLRTTPKLKTTIWDEVNAAMGQERYRRFMPQTKSYINEKIKSGLSESVRICNTGLIAFSHKNPKVIAFLDQVYSDLISIGTSECQIVWALVAQQNTSLIQTIDWEEIPILWETPD